MKFLYLSALTLLIISCNSTPEEKAVKNIMAIRNVKNLAQSDSMVNSLVRFADAYPEHDSAFQFLFEAAHLCVVGNKVPRGARLYERAGTEYKSHPKAPDALIRSGTAFAGIPDAANAKRVYDLFIAAYPQHKRIGEVKIWSETIGMTEDELFRYFRSNILKEDSSSNPMP